MAQTETNAIRLPHDGKRLLRNAEQRDGRHLQLLAAAGAVVGVLAIVLLAARSATWGDFSATAASGLALASAAALVGALLGFLFGVPRTGFPSETTAPVNGDGATNGASLGEADRPADAAGNAAASPAVVRAVGYTPNTGLEQVSDWLTKILVGVGLTQLLNIRAALQALTKRLSDEQLPGIFFVALMIYFAILGFLVGYVWTRVVASPMFKRADSRLRETVKKMVQELKKNQEKVQSVEHSLKEARKDLKEVVQKTVQVTEQVEATIRGLISALYDTANQGYQRAIREALAFLRSHGDPRSYLFWLYLAAAYGQLAASVQNTPEFDDARREALAAIEKALAYDTDGTARSWLKMLLEGKIHNEDDLAVFQNDPEFAAILG